MSIKHPEQGGLLQKPHVGVRLYLEAEVSANVELTFSSELTELNLPLGSFTSEKNYMGRFIQGNPNYLRTSLF